MASRLSRRNDSGFTYLFTMDRLFCDDRLREMDLEQFITQTLKDDGYNLIIFLDSNGIRFGSRGMAGLMDQCLAGKDDRRSQIPQRRFSQAAAEMVRKNISPEGDRSQDLHRKMDPISSAETMSNLLHRSNREIRLAIIINGLELWNRVDDPSVHLFLRENMKRQGDDLVIFNFAMTSESAAALYANNDKIGYLPEWRDSISHPDKNYDNIVRIGPPSAAEIKNLLYRRHLIGQICIENISKIDELALLLYKATRSSNMSLGSLSQRLDIYSSNPDRTPLNRSNIHPALGFKSPKDVLANFDDLVGIDKVKEELNFVSKSVNMINDSDDSIRYVSRLDPNFGKSHNRNLLLHMALKGNPGTGKTTIAEMLGAKYEQCGALTSGHVVKCTAKDLIAGYIGQSAIKTSEKIQEALGGVLFIDEISGFVGETDSSHLNGNHGFLPEVTGALLSAMTTYSDLAVVIAGYPDDIDRFIASNSGYATRFSHVINMEDYSASNLSLIFRKMLDGINKNRPKGEQYTLCPEFAEISKDPAKPDFLTRFMEEWLVQRPPDNTWGNARNMEILLRKMIENNADGDLVLGLEDVPKEIILGNKTYDLRSCVNRAKDGIGDPLEEMSRLIGLSKITQSLRSICNLIRYSIEFGQDLGSINMNYVFYGNPGTGKTTVARLMGRMLANTRALSKASMVEVKPSDLTDRTVGEARAKRLFERSIGGVLFIDEAYTLYNIAQRDEIITELLTFAENYRGKVCIILAGYKESMERVFTLNEGMRSRFTEYIDFPDYTSEQLMQIFQLFCKNKLSYDAEPDSPFMMELAHEMKILHSRSKLADFGNARDVRKYFDKCRSALADRIRQQYAEFLEVTSGDKISRYRIVTKPEDVGEGTVLTGEKVSIAPDSRCRIIRCDADGTPISILGAPIESISEELTTPVNYSCKMADGHVTVLESEKFVNTDLNIEDLIMARHRIGWTERMTSSIETSLEELRRIPAPRDLTHMTDTKLAERLSESSVLITTDHSTGSGIIISPDGLILTAAHVIKGADEIKARLFVRCYGGTVRPEFVCEEIITNPVLDISLLHISADCQLPYVPLDLDAPPTPGDELMLVSYPFGEENPVHFKGSVASEMKRSLEVLLNIEAKRGSSGGMCFSKSRSKVIGLLKGSITYENEEINQAMSVLALHILLGEGKDVSP